MTVRAFAPGDFVVYKKLFGTITAIVGDQADIDFGRVGGKRRRPLALLEHAPEQPPAEPEVESAELPAGTGIDADETPAAPAAPVAASTSTTLDIALQTDDDKLEIPVQIADAIASWRRVLAATEGNPSEILERATIELLRGVEKIAQQQPEIKSAVIDQLGDMANDAGIDFNESRLIIQGAPQQIRNVSDGETTAAGLVTGKASELLSLAAIKPEATDWLWNQRIPRGAQTISTGWPGVGKSQQQCEIIAHVSTGAPWPDGSPCQCGDTIMLTCEDSYTKTIIPRLLAVGANLERVKALPFIHIDNKTKRAFLLTEDLDELDRHLASLPNALLVTIDPITGFLGAGKINSNSVTDIRGTLAPLSDLAERRNVAIHTVTHPPKVTTSAMNAFIGSQAFVAASRMAHLTTEETDEDGKATGRYLLTMVRSSLGPMLPTLAYHIGADVVKTTQLTRTEMSGKFPLRRTRMVKNVKLLPSVTPPARQSISLIIRRNSRLWWGRVPRVM